MNKLMLIIILLCFIFNESIIFNHYIKKFINFNQNINKQFLTKINNQNKNSTYYNRNSTYYNGNSNYYKKDNDYLDTLCILLF